MKQNNRGFAPIIVLAVLIILIVTGLFAFRSTSTPRPSSIPPIDTEAQDIPTETPSSQPTPVLEGYPGYNKEGKRFTLNLLEECQGEYRESFFVFNWHKISCTTKDFVITITPDAGGRGLHGYQPKEYREGEKFVSKYKWKYGLWVDEDGTAFSSYSLTDPDTNDYYLIHVRYSPYSIEAFNYFDQILSTFKFLE